MGGLCHIQASPVQSHLNSYTSSAGSAMYSKGGDKIVHCHFETSLVPSALAWRPSLDGISILPYELRAVHELRLESEL